MKLSCVSVHSAIATEAKPAWRNYAFGSHWRHHSGVVVISGACGEEIIKDKAQKALDLLERRGGGWLHGGVEWDELTYEIQEISRAELTDESCSPEEGRYELQLCVLGNQGLFRYANTGRGCGYVVSSDQVRPFGHKKKLPLRRDDSNADDFPLTMKGGRLMPGQSIILCSSGFGKILRQNSRNHERELRRIACWMALYREEEMDYALKTAIADKYLGEKKSDMAVATIMACA